MEQPFKLLVTRGGVVDAEGGCCDRRGLAGGKNGCHYDWRDGIVGARFVCARLAAGCSLGRVVPHPFRCSKALRSVLVDFS